MSRDEFPNRAEQELSSSLKVQTGQSEFCKAAASAHVEQEQLPSQQQPTAQQEQPAAQEPPTNQAEASPIISDRIPNHASNIPRSRMPRRHRSRFRDWVPGQATLKLTICEAILNKNYGIMRMDPYCIARIGGSVVQTTVHYKGSTNPTWNETFVKTLSPTVKSLFFQIYDRQTFMTDKCIAWAIHELQDDIYDCNETTGWINLTGQLGDRKEGVLNIRLKLSDVEHLPAQYGEYQLTSSLTIPSNQRESYPQEDYLSSSLPLPTQQYHLPDASSHLAASYEHDDNYHSTASYHPAASYQPPANATNNRSPSVARQAMPHVIDGVGAVVGNAPAIAETVLDAAVSNIPFGVGIAFSILKPIFKAGASAGTSYARSRLS